MSCTRIGIGYAILDPDATGGGGAPVVPSFSWESTSGVTGSPVSAWAPLVGAGTLSQSTGAKQPTFVAAQFGTAPGISFDGSNDLLTNTTKLITPTTAGTLAIVFKTGSSVVGPMVLVSQADSGVTNDWFEVGINADGFLYVERNASGNKRTVVGSTLLVASTVYDMELAFDGTDYFVELSGVEENPLTYPNFATGFAWFGAVGGTPGLSLGATLTSGGSARFFNGSLGAVYFWSTDITA